MLGGAFDFTKNVALTVKDKVHEYELGGKLVYAGEKTANVLYAASWKIFEKGSEIAVI